MLTFAADAQSSCYTQTSILSLQCHIRGAVLVLGQQRRALVTNARTISGPGRALATACTRKGGSARALDLTPAASTSGLECTLNSGGQSHRAQATRASPQTHSSGR